MRRRLDFPFGRRLLAAKDGASTAEFAIVFPAFFLLLFAVFEFARVFWAINTLQFAVAQGARYVMVSGSAAGRPTGTDCQTGTWTPGTFQTSITTYLQTQLTAWGLSSATLIWSVPPQLDCSQSPPTVTVTITASYTFSFWLTDLASLLSTIPLTQRATITAPI
jgi:Flp pilus assembly protein TadG